MSKRIAIVATVPDDTDPSDLLEKGTEFFVEVYDLDEEQAEVTVYDPINELRLEDPA